jgi:hypothetical protein
MKINITSAKKAQASVNLLGLFYLVRMENSPNEVNLHKMVK